MDQDPLSECTINAINLISIRGQTSDGHKQSKGPSERAPQKNLPQLVLPHPYPPRICPAPRLLLFIALGLLIARLVSQENKMLYRIQCEKLPFVVLVPLHSLSGQAVGYPAASAAAWTVATLHCVAVEPGRVCKTSLYENREKATSRNRKGEIHFNIQQQINLPFLLFLLYCCRLPNHISWWRFGFNMHALRAGINLFLSGAKIKYQPNRSERVSNSRRSERISFPFHCCYNTASGLSSHN